jgi:uncharacterized protein (DUF697 family)
MQSKPYSEAIIADHTSYAMASALIPVPFADVAAVTLVQLDMVKALADAYEVEYDRSRTRALILSLAGATAARLGASALKVLPGFGTIAGATTQVVLSGASTFALGQIFMNHFEQRGSLEGFETDALRERYQLYLERGRRIARALRDSALPREDLSLDEVADALERLGRLRASGVISEAEFDRLKAEALGDAAPAAH